MTDYKKPILNKDGKPLKILAASAHCCIRVIKKMRALKKIGYGVYGLANRVSYGTEDFETFSVYHSKEQFQKSITLNRTAPAYSSA